MASYNSKSSWLRPYIQLNSLKGSSVFKSAQYPWYSESCSSKACNWFMCLKLFFIPSILNTSKFASTPTSERDDDDDDDDDDMLIDIWMDAANSSIHDPQKQSNTLKGLVPFGSNFAKEHISIAISGSKLVFVRKVKRFNENFFNIPLLGLRRASVEASISLIPSPLSIEAASPLFNCLVRKYVLHSPSIITRYLWSLSASHSL